MTALAGRQLQSPFDPISRPFYGMLGGMAAIVLIVLTVTDFTVSRGQLLNGFLAMTGICISGLAARRIGMERTARALEAVSLTTVVGSVTLAAIAMVSALARPFADQQLSNADALLHLNWMDVYRLYQRFPALNVVGNWVYTTFLLQSIVMPLLLFTDRRRFWIFQTAWLMASIVAVCIHPFFPAICAFEFYRVPQTTLAGLDPVFPLRVGERIAALRNGTARDIAEVGGGLIAMPSFHAIGGCLFIWAAFGMGWLRWPLVLLNIAMIASAVVAGAHYFVDIFAGIAVALVTLGIAQEVVKG